MFYSFLKIEIFAPKPSLLPAPPVLCFYYYYCFTTHAVSTLATLEQNIPRGRIQTLETFSVTMKLKALYESSYKDVICYEFKVKREKIR
jgi:hypothetical protein